MQLAHDALAGRRRLAGVEERILRTHERRLGLQRVVERLDDALAVQEAALGNRRNPQALVRELAVREVDAGDLEQSDPIRAGVAIADCRLDEAREQTVRSAVSSTLIGSSRFQVVSSAGRRLGVYVSENPRPTSVSSTRRRRRCSPSASRTSRAAAGSVNGTSSSRKRAISSTTSISRVTSRARHVGTTTSPSRCSKPSRPSSAYWSPGGVSIPITRVGPVRPEADDRPFGQLSVRVGVRGPPRAGQVEQQLGREVRRGPGEMRVDALLPAVRALGAQAEALARAEEAVRLEVRRLEQHGRVRVADLGVLPAHDPGERDRPLRVGDQQVVLAQLTVDAVERAEPFAQRAPAARRFAAVERRVVEGVKRVAEREHHVVRHVDDVRDRAHSRREQTGLEPDR